jgi:hypothetical protein
MVEHVGVVRCLYMDEYKLVSAGDKRKIIVWDLAGIEEHAGKNNPPITLGRTNILYRHPALVHKMVTTPSLMVTASPDMPGGVVVMDFGSSALEATSPSSPIRKVPSIEVAPLPVVMLPQLRPGGGGGNIAQWPKVAPN